MESKPKKLINFRFVFYPFLAFLFGTAIARNLYGGDVLTLCAVITLILLLCAVCLFFRKLKPLIFLLIFFFLGNGCFFLSYNLYQGKDYKGENFIIGRVTDDLQFDNDNCFVVLEDVLVNGENAKNISLTIRGVQALSYGDEIAFKAKLNKVNLFGYTFKSYFLRDNVAYTAKVDYENIEIFDNYLKFDESFRLKVKNLLFENMSEDRAGLCFAMLFGEKSFVSDQTYSAFRDAGIIHLLTVSGLHVGFLVALVYFILKLCRLGRVSTTIITSILLLIYNILCGFAPSVMRASIMAVVMMLAKLSGRQYDGLNALSLAGFVILFIQPLYAYDLGFLMSFFCVEAIFMLQPVLSKGLRYILPNKFANYISLSISAQAGILPFMASMGQNLNFLSFFSNLIIVPAFAVIYPLLFVCSCIGVMLPIGPIFVGFDFVLALVEKIAAFFALTSLKVRLSPFNIILDILIFAIIFVSSRFFMVKKPKKLAFLGVLSVFLIICSIFSFI